MICMICGRKRAGKLSLLPLISLVMNMTNIAKQIAKDILKEEKTSDFNSHQLVEFWMEDLKDEVVKLLEFPGKIN